MQVRDQILVLLVNSHAVLRILVFLPEATVRSSGSDIAASRLIARGGVQFRRSSAFAALNATATNHSASARSGASAIGFDNQEAMDSRPKMDRAFSGRPRTHGASGQRVLLPSVTLILYWCDCHQRRPQPRSHRRQCSGRRYKFRHFGFGRRD